MLVSLGTWVCLASLLCLHHITKAPGCAPDGAGLPQGPAVTAPPRLLSVEEIQELIRQPASLFGRVQKGGLPANYSFMMAHLTDTNPDVREEGIPATMGPAVMRWFAHAYT